MTAKQSTPYSSATEQWLYEAATDIHEYLGSEATDDASAKAIISQLRFVADQLEQNLVTFKNRT